MNQIQIPYLLVFYLLIIDRFFFIGVILAKNINTNEFAAVKVIRIDSLKGTNIDIQDEINFHKLFQHENIIRFYDYEQKTSIYYLYLEYAAAGDLLKKIEIDGVIQEYRAQH
ncbi:unnamed protein product [Rotaria sp. Silwood1]|nr:unnamed protein product [Rotaria sp. Silwood1]CAF4947122.1 unnamed protein product [Rotaria sp. Silwood1]